MKKNIREMNQQELEVFFDDIGEKKFRAKQVWQWIYRGAASFDEMTDLSKDLREKLKEKAELSGLTLLKHQNSKADGTRKYLFGLKDGNAIESVFMKYKFGNSACISSQAGCKMGCRFCASGAKGFERNLTAGEMVDQMICIERDTGEKISSVVVMGTGEPFDNYGNLTEFIRRLNSKDGLNIGMRNITVSTCGIIPRMEQFAKDFPQVNLAISLHAPNNAIRSALLPINTQYPIEELILACKRYTEKTGRRITFEYALIKGVNDSMVEADELASRLRGLLCHVNLIPLNRVTEAEFRGTERSDVKKFWDRLEKRGIRTTIRRELGADIDAACGQLRLCEK